MFSSVLSVVKKGDKMKIAMMGGWNTDSGASFHAELVGRNWIDQGQGLKVFTFYDYAFHGTQITGKDEDYVERCFTVSSYTPPNLNPVPFLTEDYEVFVVQDLGMLPKDLLGKIFHRIKKRAKVINVIHDGNLSEDPSFYQFDWDAIVCFDERYRKFLVSAYDSEKVRMIPYPCLPYAPGDKKAKREKLGLPQDKHIIFSFGPASNSTLEVMPSIAELASKYPILVLTVTKHKEALEGFVEASHRLAPTVDIEIREEAPPTDELYDYLHASDVLIFNKTSTPQVVVSSTAFQCLGSGCPIVAKESNYVEFFDKEVLRYSDVDTFKSHLSAIFDKTEAYERTLESAKKYVIENSAQEIGKKYIELFKSL